MSPAPGAERLKAVLDTNIYIAAFQFPKGRSAVLWHAAESGRYQLVVSPAIIGELARVLGDDFSWDDERVRRLVRRVVEIAGEGLVAPRRAVAVVTADPDDNRIRECAAEGKADLIVSNDHQLLDVKTWHSDRSRRRLPTDARAEVITAAGRFLQCELEKSRGDQFN